MIKVADQKRRRLTARRKFEIYLETRSKDAPVGEILRQHGLHLNDLRSIEDTVESSALEALKNRSSGPSKEPVSADEYNALVQELRRKEKALTELTVEYTLLKKNDTLSFMVPSEIGTSKGRPGKRS